MKRLVVKYPENCVQCHSCEEACSLSFYKVMQQDLSCIRIKTDRKGNDVIYHCNQCGKCEQVCPVFAISRNAKGVYTIDKNVCVGCMACVDVCPQNVICKSYDNIFATKCIACGICVKSCPQEVLAIEDVEEA